VNRLEKLIFYQSHTSVGTFFSTNKLCILCAITVSGSLRKCNRNCYQKFAEVGHYRAADWQNIKIAGKGLVNLPKKVSGLAISGERKICGFQPLPIKKIVRAGVE
jgi:hypothetical protein